MADLIQGGPLLLEDLDLSGMGLYLDSQKDKLGGDESDWFLTNKTNLGRRLWARKSDQGKKWHIYDDVPIVLHKELVKKENK